MCCTEDGEGRRRVLTGKKNLDDIGSLENTASYDKIIELKTYCWHSG